MKPSIMLARGFIILLLSALLLACGAGSGGGGGGGKGTTGAAGTTYTFQDNDRMTLGGDTFTGLAGDGSRYSGTLATASNGYLVMTITATEDAANHPLGAYYGLELPGSALFIFVPTLANSSGWQAYIGKGPASCPTTPGTLNFVQQPGTSLAVSNETLGTVNYSDGGGAVNFDSGSIYRVLDLSEVTGATLSTGMACANGKFTDPDPTSGWDFTVTAGGLWLGDGTSASGGETLALPVNSTPIPMAVGTVYRGFAMGTEQTGGPNSIRPFGSQPTYVDFVTPIWARGTGTGIEAGHMTDFSDPIPAPGTGAPVTVSTWTNGRAWSETLANSAECGNGICPMRYMTYGLGTKLLAVGMELNLLHSPTGPSWRMLVLYQQ